MISAVVAAVAATLLMTSLAMAQGKGWDRDKDHDDCWVPLGRQEVDFRAERDTIQVGKDEGKFRRIRVVVRGAPIELRDLKIWFGDGAVFDPKVTHRLREDAAFVLDLPGDRRVIERIGFLYRSTDRKDGKATVMVFGRH
jgi:hypothetical protein